MIVNLIKNKEMFSVTLPNKIKGQYWLSDFDNDGNCRQLVSIEAYNGQWVLKSNKLVSILDNDSNAIANVTLNPQSFFNLAVKDENERVILFAEAISESRNSFSKVLIKSACEITIGRTSDNNIYFNNNYVSRSHCTLSYSGNNWSIVDRNSRNGTFVNGYRVDSQNLVAGDFIYIMGLKIVIGSNFLAINNPDGNVTLQSPQFVGFQAQQVSERTEEIENEIPDYFYRSPRFKRQMATAQIKIDPPPAIQKQDDVPLALMLGPSMTMGIASLSTAVMAVVNYTSGQTKSVSSLIPTLCMSFSMLLGTVMWPILTKKHDKKMKIKNEQKRQDKYLAYLDTIRDKIKKECKDQSDILNENIISLDECAERITMVKRSLWERVIGQDDFLRLRLGIGNLPLDAEIKCAEKKFTMDDDNLQDAMLALGDEKKELINVPISISLIDDFISGVIGSYNDIISLSKSLILQIVSLHSYDEVKLILIADKENKNEWDFVKCLPHFWNNDKTMRMIAFDYDDVKELSVFIENEIIQRISDNKDIDEYVPYYIILSTSKELTDKCEALNQLLEYKSNCGFSILSLQYDIKDLPKETSTVISLNQNRSKIFDKNDITGRSIQFMPEYASPQVIVDAAHTLANVQLDLSSQKFSLPNMITFMEMFNVSKIDHLNCLTRWKESNPVKTLQAPVGVDTQGEPFLLDLHEKYHGPHGLVAGMTGSGKSEFIITYILSLAVNYHPDEVAFILIDYKGGGLTGAFEDDERGIKLPHLAGTITNLDGAAVKRSLVSIQSELRRRQAIFNEARKISNEGTMDIYKYQQLRRDGVVSEPVPHLFIISDEFAELKTQQPEFMEQLISAARIGRSLGVHLILATQKPSGVVDDQIWSNSKFRVCLKVQDKADSQDMIKCADAAAISQTGRFYLQVGFNELFALGQSAWCGAEYIPTETVEKSVDESISIIDDMGRVVKQVKPEKKSNDNVKHIKQIVAIVKYLSDLAIEESVSVKPLWLDPIPARIFIKDVEKKYDFKPDNLMLNPAIGEYDDPFNQRQNILTLPLSQEGNCLVYGATGNGKTTLLATLAYSLISSYSVEALNLYILDFGSETLKAFEKAPHVGGVAISADSEKIMNLLKMLKAELDKRKQLFSEFGGDYVSYCKATGNIVPNIVVLINNYAGFSEQFEELEEVFGQLTRDGVKYGLTFVVTASSTNAMRYRYVQNFKQVVTMQLNDPTDYPIVIGKTDGLIPSKFKGRGLVNIDKVYEFQTAYCDDCDDQYEFIRKYCNDLASTVSSYAKPIPVLPEVVSISSVERSINKIDTVPFGISKQSISTVGVNIQSKYIYPIMSRESITLISFVREFIKVVDKLKECKINIIDSEFWCDSPVENAIVENNDFNGIVNELFEDVLARNNGYKAANMAVDFFDDYEERIVVIVGMEKLVSRLDDVAKDRLFAMLLKGQSMYKVHFIIIDSQDYFSTANYSEWYKAHIQGNDGVFIGDGFADQYILKTTKMNNSYYDDIGDEFGYIIRKGKSILVKFLSSEVEE